MRPVRVFVCVCARVCVSLAEQGLKVQLKASDGGVQGVELSAFLPGSSDPVGACRPGLGLKVSVEVVAALHFAEAAGQSVMEGLGHSGDGSVERGRRMRGGFSFWFDLFWLFYSPWWEEKGQATETFGALSHPQLEQHLQEDKPLPLWSFIQTPTCEKKSLSSYF